MSIDFAGAIPLVPAGLTPQHCEFLSENNAHFSSGIVHAHDAWMVDPMGSLLVLDQGSRVLVEESNWHSALEYHDGFRNDASTDWQWRWQPRQPDLTISQPVILARSRLCHIYFHWIFDVMCKLWLARQMGCLSGRQVYLGEWGNAFQRDLLTMLGIDPGMVLEAPRGDTLIQFRDLLAPIFTFQESVKTRFSRDRGIHHKGWPPEYVASIREIALDHIGEPNPQKHLKLYVSRSDASYRHVLNEGDVVELLVKQGFRVIVPGQLSVRDQVSIFSQANVVVGCHGAGLTNIVWSGPGTKVLEIMPNGYDDASYRFLAPLAGCAYQCMLAETDDPTKLDDVGANCRVDMALLRDIVAAL